MKKFLFSLIILCLVFLNTFAQHYRFKHYSADKDGIYPFIYSISQDNKGFLWVGTGEGLFRFDGQKFRIVSSEDNIEEHFITTALTNNVNQKFFGLNDGSVRQLKNNYLEILNKNSTQGNIVKLEQSESGLFAFSQNGLITVFNKDGGVVINKEILDNSYVFSVSRITKDVFLIGTDEGLLCYSYLKDSIYYIDEIPITRIDVISKSVVGNYFWIGTEDEGIYKLSYKNNGEINKIQALQIKDYEIKSPVKCIIQNKNGSLWLGTMGDGLINIPFNTKTNKFIKPIVYNSSNGLPSNYIRTIFFDREDNLWIGTYGNGLALFAEDYFTFLIEGERSKEKNINTLFSGKNYIWLSANNELIKYNKETDIYEIIDYSSIISSEIITAIYEDLNEVIWIGCQSGKIFKYSTINKSFYNVNLNTDMHPGAINYIDGVSHNVYIGSVNGFFIHNSLNNSTLHYTTNDGLPHNYINHIFIDINGRIYLATPTNYLTYIENDSIFNSIISQNNDVLRINSINQDLSGNIWIATYGQGVYMVNSNNFKNFTSENGLMSDFCYSISIDEINTVWIGHRQGLSSISGNVIKQYGKNKNLYSEFNLNTTVNCKNGFLWWGTTNGLLKYDYRKNRFNNIPPGIVIENIRIDDTDYDPSDDIVLKYGKYRIRFDFIGISLQEPELINYKYKLVGIDSEWSDFTNNSTIFYPLISDGRYSFAVKAFNSNGIESIEIATVKIKIQPPIWKTWWFILSSILIVIYFFYIVIKIRERNHKRIEEYLTKTLDERTKEVVAQKELIELKNKDITDSINYAKRIQEAILPPLDSIKKILPESFIFYKPRDIVSGDFYVFYKADNKVIFVLADATGHGVPGAFMSLIGSTIIKEILTNKAVQSPQQVLNLLEKELRIALNLNETSDDQPKDGLDISVGELDIETNIFRFASAMRPIIIISNNELEYIRGSKYSIGGTYDEERKVFIQHSRHLNKGDMIYFFSDGFPDQFGGKLGKKYKILKFKQLLTDIYFTPADQQLSIIEEEFQSWKGNLPQVDDVLIIGIKV